MIQSVTDFILSASMDCDFIFINNKELRRSEDAVDVMSGMAPGQGSVQRDGKSRMAAGSFVVASGNGPSVSDITAKQAGKKRRRGALLRSVSIAATGCLANWLAIPAA